LGVVFSGTPTPQISPMQNHPSHNITRSISLAKKTSGINTKDGVAKRISLPEPLLLKTRNAAINNGQELNEYIQSILAEYFRR